MATAMRDRPVLLFDSGVGGLTVLREARVLMPDRRFVYVADDAGFPYGAWEEGALRGRIVDLFGGLIARHNPEIVVIAFNTASTQWAFMPFELSHLTILICAPPSYPTRTLPFDHRVPRCYHVQDTVTLFLYC